MDDNICYVLKISNHRILHPVNARCISKSKSPMRPVFQSKPMPVQIRPVQKIDYAVAPLIRFDPEFSTTRTLGDVIYFNSSKNCSTFASSDLRKFLTFCAAALSGVCFWRKISEMLDEPPPFHARIWRLLAKPGHMTIPLAPNTYVLGVTRDVGKTAHGGNRH